VSLVGGASLGPADALGKMGGGLGTWVSGRQGLTEDARATNTLSGMAAAYGGLLPSPILATIFVLEIARTNAGRFTDRPVARLLSSSVAFVGGPFLVMLFIGGTFGTATHVLIPAVPEGFAFAAMVAALPGALVAGPFSVIVLAALTTQIGAPQIAPVAIAVITAYLAVSGTGTLIALVRRASTHAPGHRAA
jgi:H+/Cl- antiporter ClcA